MEERQQLHYWGDTEEQEFYRQQGIKGTHSRFPSTTPNCPSLFTRSWAPLSSPPRALLFLLHGYGNDTSWTFQSTPVFLAQHGFACFSLDLPGHGRSDGLRAFLPSLHPLVLDSIAYFSSVASSPEFQSVRPRFLFGESMGAAICLLIHLNGGLGVVGAVLIAPMCRISDKLKPPWPLLQALAFLGRLFPTLPIVPSPDLLDKSVKVPHKKVIGAKNPMRYTGRLRLGTAIELLRVTEYLGQRLGEVTMPFLVLHGSDDVVTDPEVSRALHQEAASADKTLKMYPGMMHSLLFGETDENVETVRTDILAWLNHRSSTDQQQQVQVQQG